MKITGIIFDMDGTLADSLGAWDVLYECLGEKYRGDKSFRPSGEVDTAMRTLTLAGAMELLHNECHMGESGTELLVEAERICLEFYEKRVEMKAGVLDFLEFCRQRGIRICVASATARHLLEVLVERYELTRYFDKIFSCGDIGRGKEHPDIFLQAHAYLGTPKESTWLVEDSLVALKTAKAAGFHTVGIWDKYNPHQADIKATVNAYIGEGETLMRLVGDME